MIQLGARPDQLRVLLPKGAKFELEIEIEEDGEVFSSPPTLTFEAGPIIWSFLLDETATIATMFRSSSAVDSLIATVLAGGERDVKLMIGDQIWARGLVEVI